MFFLLFKVCSGKWIFKNQFLVNSWNQTVAPNVRRRGSSLYLSRWIFIPLGQTSQSIDHHVPRQVWFPPREPFWGAPAALGSLSRSPAGNLRLDVPAILRTNASIICLLLSINTFCSWYLLSTWFQGTEQDQFTIHKSNSC